MKRSALEKPHISEKASFLEEKKLYVFRVSDRVNKKEIKEEIEKKYKVKVIGVRIIRIPSKKRRVGRIEGTRKSYKKAIVRLKKDQSIDITNL